VPALADDAAADDGDDGEDAAEEPVAGDWLVAAEAEPSAPGDRKASGAVVPSAVAEGAGPLPP